MLIIKSGKREVTEEIKRQNLIAGKKKNYKYLGILKEGNINAQISGDGDK